jgi:hypothetical protein
MTAEPDRFPWDDSPEFDQVMQTYERTYPIGPALTLIRRAVMWRIYNEPPWTLPDDPLDTTERLPSEATP